MSSTEFDVILADPRWSYTGSQTKWAAAAKFYPTMTTEEIVATDIPSRLAPRGVLFMWATSPLLHTAIDVIDRWGLAFRGVAFVWVKTKRSDPMIPVGAQGVRPSIVKPTTEFVVSASRVAEGRPMPVADESIRQVVLAPKSEHSRKPDEVQDRIDLLYPNSAKLEMFARRRRPGWESWGNEVPA